MGTVYNNIDIESFCHQKGIIYIPIYKELERMKSENQTHGDLFFKDHHPTDIGNERLALFLSEALLSHIRIESSAIK